MKKSEIQQIFKTFSTLNPKPTTELKYHSPFELLVAVILSAQATDVSVNKATQKLFPVANTPEQIVGLGIHGLSHYIKSIGLYNAKAKNILLSASILLDKFQGGVPSNRTDLESLPGVGRKTANVILNTLFNQSVIAVDTHIFRVSNRIGLAHASTPHKVEEELMKVIPKPYIKNAHHWLVLHGRYVCKAKNPLCNQCPIVEWCENPHKNNKL